MCFHHALAVLCHRAVESGSPAMVQLLLEQGLGPSAEVLEAAVDSQHPAVLALLLQAHAGTAMSASSTPEQQVTGQKARQLLTGRASKDSDGPEGACSGSWGQSGHTFQPSLTSVTHGGAQSGSCDSRVRCLLECVGLAARKGWAVGCTLLLQALEQLQMPEQWQVPHELTCSWVIAAIGSGDLGTLRSLQGDAGIPLWAVADAVAEPCPDLARRLVAGAAGAGHGEMLEEILSHVSAAGNPGCLDVPGSQNRRSHSQMSSHGGCTIPYAAALAVDLVAHAFVTAACKGHAQLAARLATRGARADSNVGGQALLAAAARGDVALSRLLLAAGADACVMDSLALVHAAGLRGVSDLGASQGGGGPERGWLRTEGIPAPSSFGTTNTGATVLQAGAEAVQDKCALPQAVSLAASRATAERPQATEPGQHQPPATHAISTQAPATAAAPTAGRGVPYEPAWPVRMCRNCYACQSESRDAWCTGSASCGSGEADHQRPEATSATNAADQGSHTVDEAPTSCSSNRASGSSGSSGGMRGCDRAAANAGQCMGPGCHGGCQLAARMAGVAQLVGLLLEHGASARARGYDALLAAVRNRHSAPVVRLLLAHGADARAQGSWALSLASQAGDAETAQLLLQHGAQASGQAGAAALYSAVVKGHVPMTRLLLQHGVRVDTRLGMAAARVACESGDGDMVRVLGEFGSVSCQRELLQLLDNDA